jgi:hypothetical protein
MMVVNVAVVLCIPRLVLWSFPEYPSLSRAERWLVHLAFYAFVPTRVAVWLGQISLLVFALMLAVLWIRERSWLLAGICLGLALSKYAVTLPLVLLLLLRWRRTHVRILVTALFVQLAGILLIALRSGDSALRLLLDHVDVFLSFAYWTGAFGTQLGAILPAGIPLAVAGLLAALLVAALLSWWLRQWKRLPVGLAPLAGYHLWVVLVLSTLLVVYHSGYDVLMTVVFLPLGLYAVGHPDPWRLTTRQTRFLSAVVLLLVVMLILPGSIVNVVLSDAATQQWLDWVERGVTWTVVLVLGTAAWLWVRLLRRRRSHEA